MFNSQLKQNSEPIKSTQPTYGGGVSPKPGGGTKSNNSKSEPSKGKVTDPNLLKLLNGK